MDFFSAYVGDEAIARCELSIIEAVCSLAPDVHKISICLGCDVLLIVASIGILRVFQL
jgi:hypothetical protein